MTANIITISDVVLGYGSPQIHKFTESLCEYLGYEGLILQPMVPERPFVNVELEYSEVQTIVTLEHPYWPLGRTHHLKIAANIINELKPEIIVFTNYNMLAAVDYINYKPDKIIHLVLEDFEHMLIENSYSKIHELRFNHYKDRIDIWIFPESNRAEFDVDALSIKSERVFIFYNVSDIVEAEVKEKNNKIVYAGTLDTKTSIGKYIFDSEMKDFPIDVYGDLIGLEDSKDYMQNRIDHLQNLGDRNKVNWFGQVPANILNAALPNYAFSLVFWLPHRHALLNAAPNKFFQAISLGVPVIAAPHPQCKELIERYECGIVLNGWEKEDLIHGLEDATALMGTADYETMVDNCKYATEVELSWDIQIQKFFRRFDFTHKA